MKKLTTLLAMTGVLTGASWFNAQRSDAILFWAISSELNSDAASVLVIGGCIVLMPLCLLDEKGGVNQEGAMDPSFLAESGYNNSEVDQIVTDQRKVQEALSRIHAKLLILKSDTIETIRSGIKEIIPDVSEVYVQFLNEYAPRQIRQPTE